jgi:hypothetical protein
MTNLPQIYLDNEVLYPFINDFLRNTFMSIFSRGMRNKGDVFINVDEKPTTWLKCQEDKDKVELSFKIWLGKPENNFSPPEYVIMDSPMYIKIYATNESYDNALGMYKNNELLYEPENVLTHSLYQKLLYVMIEENTLDSIKIRYPYQFGYFEIKTFSNGSIYNEHLKTTLKYLKLLDDEATGHIEITIKENEVKSRSIVELKTTGTGFYHPSEINAFFDRKFENRNVLFHYYCVFLRKFFKMEIEPIELMDNFEDMIPEIEKTIILLKY